MGKHFFCFIEEENTVQKIYMHTFEMICTTV